MAQALQVSSREPRSNGYFATGAQYRDGCQAGSILGCNGLKMDC